MKKIFFLFFFLCFSLTGPVSSAETTKTNAQDNKAAATIKPRKYTLNIMELTNAQNYRYGREMFLTGNYPEAVRTFREILRLDCRNRLAQYHLMKIASMDPDYSYLMDELKHLPCAAYDFVKEDFLPASIYYEKDTGILLAQIIAYNKRQRLTENEMKTQAGKYNDMVAGLEARITNLTGDNPGKLSAAARAAQLLEDERAARKAEKYIVYLKEEVSSDRMNQQKNLKDMRTRLSAADNSISETGEDGVAATAEPHSPKALSLMETITKARAELEGKEKAFARKDIDLASLQARFNDILHRLKIIQKKIAEKNSQIKSLENNLQSIQDRSKL